MVLYSLFSLQYLVSGETNELGMRSWGRQISCACVVGHNNETLGRLRKRGDEERDLEVARRGVRGRKRELKKKGSTTCEKKKNLIELPESLGVSREV